MVVSGDNFELTYDPNDTVRDLKEKIEDEKDLDPGRQKLFYTFIPMDNNQQVKDYLEDGDSIALGLSSPVSETRDRPKATFISNVDISLVHWNKYANRIWDYVPLIAGGQPMTVALKFNVRSLNISAPHVVGISPDVARRSLAP